MLDSNKSLINFTTDPNEALHQLTIAVLAMISCILAKEIITSDEYRKAVAQITVIMDQELARKRDQQGK